MKKSYLILPVAIATFGLFAFQKSGNVSVEKFTNNHLFSGGGQANLTGAPGENNCTQCHSGGTLNGATENTFTLLDGLTPVTTFDPGGQYTATLQMVSNPAKKGFSATALDISNNMAGTFTGEAIGGTQDFSQGGRDYVSHTAASNTNAVSAWAWTWDAPAGNVGPVTFYIASNAANDDGATSADMIYLSTHVIGSTASIDEEDMEEASFEAGYSSENNTVVVEFNSAVSESMFFNLVDLNGRSVFTYDMNDALIGANHEEIALPADIQNGIYVVNYFVGNKAMSANVMVQK